MAGSTTTTCCLAAFAAVTVGEDTTVAEMQAPGGPSPGQTCVLILIFTVLLQSLCVAVTYMYFTSELRQMQDKYSQSGVACFLKEDDISWDPNDEESMNNPCWQVKWQLRQFVRKVGGPPGRSTSRRRRSREKEHLGSSSVDDSFCKRGNGGPERLNDFPQIPKTRKRCNSPRQRVLADSWSRVHFFNPESLPI